MNVVDSNLKCNPDPNARTARQIGQDLLCMGEQLKSNVETAASNGDSFDAVERAVFSSVLQIGRQAVELFLALQGSGDLGPKCETADGNGLSRSAQAKSTKIRSVFGEHSFDEFVYAPSEKKAIELRTISARLSLPKQRWSFLLQEFSQMLCVDQAHDQAMVNLGNILGGKFSVDTSERVNGQLGVAAGEYLGDLPKPDAASEGKLLVATADCKGVPLVKEDCPRVAAFETAKKNPGNRRMATVASVYSVDPHVRRKKR